jgi:hypothetical protein
MFKGIGSLKNLQGGNLISRAIKAPLRLLGNILSTGLKTPASKTVLGMIPNFFKRVGGGFGRILLFGMVLTPLVDKGLRFISHSIFGKPNALLAKEKAEAEKENEKTENPDTDKLTKALEQNKAEMLTVAAKNQVSSTGTASSMIEKYLKLHAENLNKTAVTNSIADMSLKTSNVNPDLAQKIPAKEQYIPSDSRKVSQEDIEKKTKINAALDKTDSVIANAQKALGSV